MGLGIVGAIETLDCQNGAWGPMGLFTELRARARHIVGPVLGICASCYFGFHAIHGDRGLLALKQLTASVDEAREVYDQTRLERLTLERKVKLLHPDSLDPDMLEERARIMLGFGLPDEIVVLPDVTIIMKEGE